ncbi:multiple inositol polyphosphate phosphatase 1-like [Contarinia nasturtii]|uniref:multiple inositol polyphosphate phosphatase 1-like n=1 Tax=Contarinia nasturtii TaxID=265458 RepID=UPI0012D3AA87|nr:multiple inositol polyphosphate phosphatase 1-like [Contarinia nasturtii]
MEFKIKFFIVHVLLLTINSVDLINGQRRSFCCQEYCYDSDKEKTQINYFSSKTSYFIEKRKEPDSQFVVPNCTPEKIWFYVRHGARLPTTREMNRFVNLEDLRDKIIENYKKNTQPKYGAMCDRDLILLKKWKWNRNITTEYDEHLTVQGWNEVKYIAQRFKELFPTIFKTSYDKERYLFRYTDTDRSESTFQAYVDGLFGPELDTKSIEVPPGEENNNLIMPYYSCPTDKEETRGNRSEYRKYLESKIMYRLVSDVSERLGFQTPLEPEAVFDMYHMCIYDQAWNPEKTSAWCSAFTPSQIYHLEYPEDLRKYYESGHGRVGNSRLLCSLMNDMLTHLESKTEPKAIVYLTHSSSFLLLLSTLGAYKDADPLRADNYYSMSNRKWRLSNIAPLASNLATVKYNCPNEIEQEKVMFFLNEEPIEFDWCNMGLCDWKDVKEYYKIYTQVNCDEYYCYSGASATAIITKVLIAVVSMSFIIKYAFFHS